MRRKLAFSFLALLLTALAGAGVYALRNEKIDVVVVGEWEYVARAYAPSYSAGDSDLQDSVNLPPIEFQELKLYEDGKDVTQMNAPEAGRIRLRAKANGVILWIEPDEEGFHKKSPPSN